MVKKFAHKIRKSEYLKDLVKLRKNGSPLKRSLSGYEIEMTLIDKEGKVANKAPKIIKECRKSKEDFPIKEESGNNMLEIYALPHTSITKTSLYLIDNTIKVMEVCDKNGLLMYPLGTYPGTFKSVLPRRKRYLFSRKAIDKEKYEYYGARTYGFHYHYEMPRGLFNKETQFLEKKVYSKVKKTLIDSYNFLIAADPIIACFAQSSPFNEGKYYAKDSRVLFWRGGKKLNFNGLFNKHQLLGGLPPYKQTMSDLISSLKKKDKKFKKMLKKTGSPNSFVHEKHMLDYIWNPVKINKVGTLEQRGMDSNYLEICLGVSVMLKFVLRAIQQDFIHVIPSDIGEEEPFKLEGNAIFIPPHTLVRSKWQKKSAYQGLADKDIYEASKKFYNMASKLVYKKHLPTLKPIKEMLDKRRTVSDQVIDYVKRKGYSLDDNIPQEICQQIALLHSERARKNIEKTRKVYEDLI